MPYRIDRSNNAVAISITCDHCYRHDEFYIHSIQLENLEFKTLTITKDTFFSIKDPGAFNKEKILCEACFKQYAAIYQELRNQPPLTILILPH